MIEEHLFVVAAREIRNQLGLLHTRANVALSGVASKENPMEEEEEEAPLSTEILVSSNKMIPWKRSQFWQHFQYDSGISSFMRKKVICRMRKKQSSAMTFTWVFQYQVHVDCVGKSRQVWIRKSGDVSKFHPRTINMTLNVHTTWTSKGTTRAKSCMLVGTSGETLYWF